MHKSQVSCISAERHVVHFRDKTGMPDNPIFPGAEGLWLPKIASVILCTIRALLALYKGKHETDT